MSPRLCAAPLGHGSRTTCPSRNPTECEAPHTDIGSQDRDRGVWPRTLLSASGRAWRSLEHWTLRIRAYEERMAATVRDVFSVWTVQSALSRFHRETTIAACGLQLPAPTGHDTTRHHIRARLTVPVDHHCSANVTTVQTCADASWSKNWYELHRHWTFGPRTIRTAFRS